MQDPKRVEDDIRQRLANDSLTESLGQLSDYLGSYPGHDALVAFEWLAASRSGRSRPAIEKPASLGAGRYELLREIGRGGQGSVFAARDTALRRPVAIKILSQSKDLSKNAIDRFRREAMLASRLEDPGICQIYDAGEEGDVAYLVMRLVEGQTLAQLIQKTKAHSSSGSSRSMYVDLSIANDGETIADGIEASEPATVTTQAQDGGLSLIRLFENVARSLHAAHECGIIHRDIKPANLMITPDDDAVILDFGLALEDRGEFAALSLQGEINGTPAYMSPEQLELGIVVDRRTDVYSLGVTMYEALALARPFEEPTRRRLFEAVTTKAPTPLHSVNPKVNHDLEIVIHTAMDKDRDRRYQTAEDLANDLRRVRKHEPILARPAGLMLRLQRWYQRNPALARSVFAAVAILVMGTVASSLLAARANRESRRADRENMEYRRLADFSRLDELQAEARDQLWPARERTIPAIQDWLGRARRLAAQLPVHRAALEELRRSGKLQRTVLAGIDGADVAQQKRNLIFENEELERFWRQALDTGDAAPQDEEALDQRMDWIERSLANLDDGTVNEVWVFESTDLQWRHDQLMTLVEKLEAFVTSAVTETSGLRSVEARLEHARDVISTTIDAHRTLWDTTLVEIASSPRYAGLEMEPQAGLVPLGMSPQGYAEFAHCASGAIPRRAASGELELSEDSAIVLVLLPGGVFHMGSPLSEEAREDPEAMHDVFLEPYFIGKFEVSQGQWVALMGSNPAEYPPGSIIKGNPVDQPVTLLHPVETVTWRQCTDFSRRADLELPTEAQWEFACRGGRNTAYAWGDAAECLIDRANVGDQALLRVNPRYSQLTCVAWNDGWGTHAPIQNGACNDFGLYGLHGNLSEWTRDRYALYFPMRQGTPSDGENPLGTSAIRTFRDGSFMFGPDLGRAAKRWRASADHRHVTLGCRVARRVE